MDSGAVGSLVGAIMAALLGLTGIAGSTVSIAWFLFAVGSIFVILAIVFLVVEARPVALT